jgi:DNA-binding MarR family transcriptional regulator
MPRALPSSRHDLSEAFTGLVLALFRAHGSVLASGERLVAPLGLTSSRWQVLGALALADKPLTVPSIASAMGLTRQGVQRQVDLMVGSGLVELRDNPTHQRSPLVALTASGARLFAQASRLQLRWARAMAAGLEVRELEMASDVLERIRARLDHHDRAANAKQGKGKGDPP